MPSLSSSYLQSQVYDHYFCFPGSPFFSYRKLRTPWPSSMAAVNPAFMGLWGPVPISVDNPWDIPIWDMSILDFQWLVQGRWACRWFWEAGWSIDPPQPCVFWMVGCCTRSSFDTSSWESALSWSDQKQEHRWGPAVVAKFAECLYYRSLKKLQATAAPAEPLASHFDHRSWFPRSHGTVFGLVHHLRSPDPDVCSPSSALDLAPLRHQRVTPRRRWVPRGYGWLPADFVIYRYVNVVSIVVYLIYLLGKRILTLLNNVKSCPIS